VSSASAIDSKVASAVSGMSGFASLYLHDADAICDLVRSDVLWLMLLVYRGVRY